MTIKGVQKMLRERGSKTVIARGRADAELSLEPTDGALPEGMLPLDLPEDAATRFKDLKSRIGAKPGADDEAMDPARIRRSIKRLEALLKRLEAQAG